MARVVDFPNPVVLLFAANVDMNDTTDQAIPILIPCTTYHPTQYFLDDANGSVATAAGGLYTGTGKPAGGILIAAATTYATITAADEAVQMTPTAKGRATQSAQTLYFSLTTAEGAARTARLRIYGNVRS